MLTCTKVRQSATKCDKVRQSGQKYSKVCLLLIAKKNLCSVSTFVRFTLSAIIFHQENYRNILPQTFFCEPAYSLYKLRAVFSQSHFYFNRKVRVSSRLNQLIGWPEFNRLKFQSIWISIDNSPIDLPIFGIQSMLIQSIIIF